MRRASVLALLAVTGCDEILGSGDELEVGSGEPQKLRPLLAQGKQVLPSLHSCYGVCPIAAGGATFATVDFNDGTGVTAMTDEAYVNAVVNREWATGREYLLTATDVAGETTMVLLSDTLAPTEILLETKPVRDVSMIPASKYRRATTGATDRPLAYMPGAREVVIRLHGPNNWNTGDPLVDTTLAITSADAEQLAWDRYTLPEAIGHHAITVDAESFSARTFEVDIVDGIDRIEGVIEGEPGLHKPMTVCFHAFRGEQEVFAPFVITKPGNFEWKQTNCVENYFPDWYGEHSYTASAFGRSTTVSFVVAQ